MPVRNVLKWCVVSFAPPRSRALALFLSPRAASSVEYYSQSSVKDSKDPLRTKTRGEERFHIADKEVESGTRRDGTRLNLLLRVCDLGWDLEETVRKKRCTRGYMRSYPGDFLELLQGLSESDQVESLRSSQGEYTRSL